MLIAVTSVVPTVRCETHGANVKLAGI